MYIVYLSLGSNLGDRLQNLTRAVDEIRLIADIRALSSIYETEPVGMDSDQPFLNMVMEITTSDYPPVLYKQFQKIERTVGRRAATHMRPRELDIDILLYRGWSFEDERLTIPHPGLEHRRFVLEPLCEIAPTAIHPVLSLTVATLLRNCHDRHSVTRTGLTITLPLTDTQSTLAAHT